LAKICEELVPPPAKQALADIPDLGRKLLALRIYLRDRSRLAQRWSWTNEQIKAFQASAGQNALLDEVGRRIAHSEGLFCHISNISCHYLANLLGSRMPARL
jgi:hypothetical protein